MKTSFFVTVILVIASLQSSAQNFPVFGPEINVNVTGLTFDAMEPFISADEQTLFFNSLNSGGNTNLHYATRVNDTTFTYQGMVGGIYDPSPGHLDAVASADTANNFFWVSMRGYPAPMENLHRGVYAAGSVSDISRVYGTFNIYGFSYPFGWLIMDAAINPQGDRLYYCNALFDFLNTTCVGIPCEAKLGIAQKINDSVFNKTPDSDLIMANINDTTQYIIYAPQVTMDGLELYFTRLMKGTYNTEICVSVRNTTGEAFSLPQVIHSNYGYFPEAASPTLDKSRIYYHQKDSTGLYKIKMRYRTGTTGMAHSNDGTEAEIYPNPAGNTVHLKVKDISSPFTVSVYSVTGQLVYSAQDKSDLDISDLPKGFYYVVVMGRDKVSSGRFVKE